MESSEEDDDFPSIESITSQSKIDSLYQSHTEKGIRKLCCELLDLKDAVENLCGNMRTKYLAFLRISEEAVEMKHELNELRKHISSQGILLQDLMTGVCSELKEWNKINEGEKEESEDLQNSELKELLSTEADDPKMAVLESLDDLLAEHKIDETVEALVAEEKNSQELKGSADNLSAEASAYRSAFMQRKAKVEDQLVEIAEHPSVSMSELKKALSALITLGKGPLAHQLFIKSYGSRLQKNIDVLLPSCTVCPRIFPATLAKLVFSGISTTIKESSLIFGDDPIYTNRVVQWAEWEIEFFARLVKENLPSPETVSALHAACVCSQASLTYCTLLEKQGLKLSKLLLVLLRPYIEEVLELNFRRARRAVLNLAENEEDLPMTPRFVSPLSAFATTSDNPLIDSGLKFMYIVDEILEQITPLAVSHFGASIFSRISQLFDKYVDALIKALPGPSDDDNIELKDILPFRAETDSEQLALLGMAYTIAEELLPEAIWNLLSPQNESKELKNGTSENGSANSASPVELKEWKRRFHPSFEKLRDHFCRQYVLSFIYSGEGETRLDAKIYLSGNEEDQSPSRPLQALLAKLQQLSMVAEDVLHGKDKIQKNLLARLTETYLMWLSDEQEFWGVFEDESSAIQPKGLQKLILDMHFTVEIACYGGYPSRNVHQIASAIIARAIRAFSARGIDPQRTLPEDEWFVVTAKSAISNFLSGASESDTSEIGEEHIMHDDVIYDSEETTSSLSSIESVESFASASMGELESPMFTDPEN